MKFVISSFLGYGQEASVKKLGRVAKSFLYNNETLLP